MKSLDFTPNFTNSDVSPEVSASEPATIPTVTPYTLRLRTYFPFYAVFCLAAALFFALCFFRNSHGISYPLFVGAFYISIFRILGTLGLSSQKVSLFPAAAALLLAFHTCFSANSLLHLLDHTAQVLLGSVFLLHLCYDDRQWSIEKYTGAIAKFLLYTLGALPLPLLHSRRFLRGLKSAKNRNFMLLAGGLFLSIPVVLLLCVVLSDADAVFRFILQTKLEELFHPAAVFEFLLLFLLAFLFCYGILGSLCARTISETSAEVSRKNPLAAIGFCFMLGLLYLFFCIIQVIYLFAGKGALPDGMTYSEYARQGFFQLLAVAGLNLILVLAVLKYFRRHPILTGCLTIISLCTGILLGSSAFRMYLYVSTYGLTFLRLAVLWFLALMAVLLVGILLSLFNPSLPLFRWCLVSVTAAYCAFAWSNPDLQIARYNIARQGGLINSENASYLLSSLSADAALAIAEASIDPELLKEAAYCASDQQPSNIHNLKYRMVSSLKNIPWSGEKELIQWNPGLRTYNYSMARAKNLAMDALDSSHPETPSK